MAFNPLVDIGVNLTHSRFAADRGDVIVRAEAAGVTHIIATGVSADESVAAAALAEQYPQLLRATAGVHPHHASEWDARAAEQVATLLANPMVCAVGETGLDYYRDFSPRSQQRSAFAAQLALGVSHQQPAFCHQRDAEGDFLSILADYRTALPGAVLHCFTGDRALLERCIEWDLYIGITGWICDERRGAALRDLVRLIPRERLLIETDAPFLLPRDLPNPPSNRRNEPVYLSHILERIAALRDESLDDLATVTYANSRRLFRLS